MKQLMAFVAAGTFFFWVAPLSVTAQPAKDSIVSWTFQASLLPGGAIDLEATGTITAGWGVFSSSMPEDLPNSRIQLDTAAVNEAMVKVSDGIPPSNENNSLLGTAISYFKDRIVLRARFTLPEEASSFKGEVRYMAFRGEVFTDAVTVPFRFRKEASGQWASQSTTLNVSSHEEQRIRKTAIDLDHPLADCGGTGAEGSKSLWSIFILGILGGLLGLVMPCTFPMIPMTVSFFTKKSNDQGEGVRHAFLYGFFIFLIYVLLSVPFYFLESGNEDILNNISTNAWLNLFFAAVFLVFALSFFGLFEIVLPASIANKVDSRSGLSSMGGIFFMALTLAIVSFSCTGPILGTLLVGALNENGGALQLTVAMAGFGLALGLPFGLFALFPRWLTSLPRSGHWMNTFKIVFAFIELALMIKFLSNADLVMHWGLLKREVFIGIWVLIGAATTAYLFGWLRLGVTMPSMALSKPRIMTGVLFAVFTIYLIPGLTNTRWANLSLISGFPPPLTYSLYGHRSAPGKGVEPKITNDYEQALALSQKTGKPLLLDFTGWACVNCRKMEEQVWPREGIKEVLENEVILVSLYVDDRKALPDDRQFLYKMADGSSKEIRTIGDLYATMQAENFRNASQPLYVLLGPGEQLLNRPVGYTPDVAAYQQWLQCGLQALRK